VLRQTIQKREGSQNTDAAHDDDDGHDYMYTGDR